MPEEPTGSRRISVTKQIGAAYKVGKLFYKVAQHYGYVRVYCQRKDVLGRLVEDHLHDVHLGEGDKEHLRNGGKLVIVHGCGTEVHFRAPGFLPL
jgi:hypothetical protein